MSDRSRWHIPAPVTVCGEARHPAKSALLLLAFFGFCAAIVVWRATGGRL